MHGPHRWRKTTHHEFRRLFSVHEGARNSVGSQNLVSAGHISVSVRRSRRETRADEGASGAVPVGVQFLETLSPLSELLEGDAVREALSADADALQDPVAPQLVQN